MSRPNTRQNPAPSSTSGEPTASSSAPSPDPMQEILTIMQRLEQRLNDTDKRLDDLEAIDVPDISTFVTSQAIDFILTDKFNALMVLL